MKNNEPLKKGPVTLYEQMRIKILDLIKERGIQPNQPVPSEGELAELFGVSRRTSKQALQILAEEGIVYRMPRRGTFLAGNHEDSKLTKHQKNMDENSERKKLGFIVPEINEYTGQIIAETIHEALQHDYEMVIRISEGNLKKEEDILQELVKEVRVDGIVLFPGDRVNCGNEVLRLHLNHFPIVIVDRIFKEVNIPSVYHDHSQGAYDITKHLIEKGHHYIGFVSEPIYGVMSREERYHGYIQAHQEFNISFPMKAKYIDFSIEEATSIETSNHSTKKLEEFIQENPQMTAIFCSNDYVALYVYYAAQNLEIKVPDQLSIVGFTDLPISRLMKVPLTTVGKNTTELGGSAIKLLLERISNPQSEPYHILLQTDIKERSSVIHR